MKIVTEQSRMAKEAREITYQEPMPLTQSCKRCENQTVLIMLVNDDEQLLVKERPENVRVWPHDASVIAIYLCTNCGSMRARWNQA